MTDDPRKRTDEDPRKQRSWLSLFHIRVHRYSRCQTIEAPRPILDREGALIRKAISALDDDTLVEAIRTFSSYAEANPG